MPFMYLPRPSLAQVGPAENVAQSQIHQPTFPMEAHCKKISLKFCNLKSKNSHIVQNVFPCYLKKIFFWFFD
jgi:hypothetical protein